MHKECCVCTLTNECSGLAKPKKSAFAGIRQERKTWFKIVAMEEETEFSSTGIQVEGFACGDELKENHWRTLRGSLAKKVISLSFLTQWNGRSGLCPYISRAWVFCFLRKVFLGYKAFQTLVKDLPLRGTE